jgi:uncharacterized membrane protein YdcZ (DUF606 family)
MAAMVNFVVVLAALTLVAVVGGSRWTPGSTAVVPAWAWFGGLRIMRR